MKVYFLSQIIPLISKKMEYKCRKCEETGLSITLGI